MIIISNLHSGTKLSGWLRHNLWVFWIVSKTIYFVPILSLSLRKNFHYRCCISRDIRGKIFVKIYVCFVTHKDSFTAMIILTLLFVRSQNATVTGKVATILMIFTGLDTDGAGHLCLKLQARTPSRCNVDTLFWRPLSSISFSLLIWYSQKIFQSLYCFDLRNSTICCPTQWDPHAIWCMWKLINIGESIRKYIFNSICLPKTLLMLPNIFWEKNKVYITLSAGK